MKTQKRKKFTLIELIVIISIIATLAGLLVPALHMAQEKTRTIFCMNNMKQLGIALQLYVGDYDGNLPNIRNVKEDGSFEFWQQKLVNADFISWEALLCPDSTQAMPSFYRNQWETETFDKYALYNCGYGLNYKVLGDQGNTSLKGNRVKHPSEFITAGEAGYSPSGDVNYARPFYHVNWLYNIAWSGTAFPWHDNMSTCNILRYDGHVSPVLGEGFTLEARVRSLYDGPLLRGDRAANKATSPWCNE